MTRDLPCPYRDTANSSTRNHAFRQYTLYQECGFPYNVFDFEVYAFSSDLRPCVFSPIHLQVRFQEHRNSERSRSLPCRGRGTVTVAATGIDASDGDWVYPTALPADDGPVPGTKVPGGIRGFSSPHPIDVVPYQL
eukprot:1385353-Rhodomonas_salina.2